MILKNLLAFSCPLFMIFSIFMCSQKQELEDELIVKSFFEDVFLAKKSLIQISKNYRYDCGEDKSDEKFILSVKSLQIQKSYLTKNITKLKVQSYYKSSMKDKWVFEKKDRKNIYVVSVDDMIVSYVLVKKSKIVSFMYFRKGRENVAYFVPYWMLSQG